MIDSATILAEEQAAGDRAMLDRLLAEGKVMRKGPAAERAWHEPIRRKVNPTIQPKSKRRRR